MGTYTVQKIKTVKENVGNNDGKVYKIRLADQAGEITDGELFTNKFLPPAPEEGATIEATITPADNPNWLPKITLPKQGGRGGGGGFRPGKPVEERRSIAMQHAQKCAVSILENGGGTTTGAISVENVTEIAWVLFRQVLAAETTDRPA